MRIRLLLFAVALQAFPQTRQSAVVFSTSLGPDSRAERITTDSAGFIYATGTTTSLNFPCAIPDAHWFVRDFYGFVTKVQPHSGGIAWSACFPGSIGAVASNSTAAYVGMNSEGSATLFKLDPSTGKTINSMTFNAGKINALAVDSQGAIYLAGLASNGFSASTGSIQDGLGACGTGGVCLTDGFVTKLDASGKTIYSVFTKTTGGVNAIAVDSAGAVWATGTTDRYFSAHSGTAPFIVKLSANGSGVFYKRFTGGIAGQSPIDDQGIDIAVDASDTAYAVGKITEGSFQPTVPGYSGIPGLLAQLGYLIRYSASGDVLFSSYINRPNEAATAISIPSNDSAYLYVPNLSAPDQCSSSGSSQAPRTLVIRPDGSRDSILSTGGTVPNDLRLDRAGNIYAAETDMAIPAGRPIGSPNGAPTPTRTIAAVSQIDPSKPAPITPVRLVNAASNAPGRNSGGDDQSVSPGELVTMYVQGFHPGDDLHVTANGQPAPLLYFNACQINFAVPFQVEPVEPIVRIAVSVGSQEATAQTVPLAPASPGLFTTGTGVDFRLAALNQNGRVNSSANPAAPGSVVSVYLTGAGAYAQAIADGATGPLQPPFPTPVLGAQVLIGGKWIPTLYFGQAPGLIAGVVQLNFQIPADTPSGQTQIMVNVGDYSTQPGIIYVGTK